MSRQSNGLPSEWFSVIWLRLRSPGDSRVLQFVQRFQKNGKDHLMICIVQIQYQEQRQGGEKKDVEDVALGIWTGEWDIRDFAIDSGPV